jgi:hypothetical protein
VGQRGRSRTYISSIVEEQKSPILLEEVEEDAVNKILPSPRVPKNKHSPPRFRSSDLPTSEFNQPVNPSANRPTLIYSLRQAIVQ